LLSEEQIKEGQVKPAVTNLDDNPSKDNNPSTLSDNNTGKSNVKELGTTSSNNDLRNEDSEAKTVNTNLNDPFASLN
jgi:hypothetical protein